MSTSTNTSQREGKSNKPVSVPSGSQVQGTGISRGNPATPPITNEQRRQMIAVLAYHRAERRGFCEGGELDDWLAAEAEVGRQLEGHAG